MPKGFYRIAMIAACPFPEPRGTPTRILRMAEALVERGHEVHVVTYHLGQPIENHAFRIHRIPTVKSYQKRSAGPSYQKLLVLDVLLAYRVMSVLRHHRIDIIHAHHFEGMIASWPAHLLYAKPLIFDIHTLLESELHYYGKRYPLTIKKKLGRLGDKILPRFANKLIAVSDDINDKLAKHHGYNPEKIKVIPNGVELELFENVDVPTRHLAEQSNTLVFAGNLAPYQRIDLLLQAFHEVRKQRPDTRLKMLTDSDFSNYEALARELGVRENIDLRACQLKDLPRQLASSAIALNPRTECDGLPQKLLNYMAAGAPVVSFEGSAKHFEHEQHGLVVENSNTKAFADAIIRLLDHRCLGKKYAENARGFVLSEMSWGKTAEQVELIYEQVLRGKQSNVGETGQ